MSQVKTGRRFTFDEFAIKSHNSSFSVQIFTYIDSKAKKQQTPYRTKKRQDVYFDLKSECNYLTFAANSAPALNLIAFFAGITILALVAGLIPVRSPFSTTL